VLPTLELPLYTP
jgi:hypothetical protein